MATHLNVLCRPGNDASKIAMALLLKAEDASETEDFESDPKIVKFAVLKQREESHAEKED